MRTKRWGMYGIIALSSLVFTACGSSQGDKEKGSSTASEKQQPAVQAKPLEPVTLNLVGTNLSDQMFQDLIVKPLSVKYPHITVQYVKSTNLRELLSSGQAMDLYLNWAGLLASDIELQTFMDITPLLKTHNVNLTRFDPKAIDTTRKVSAAGSNADVLYGLPYLVGLNGLFYNKDIFDRFGVAYPKDGMTWEEAIELGKRLTRSENGVNYIGLDVDSYARMTFPLSLGVVDAKTNKSIVNSDAYRMTLGMMKKLYDAQGITSMNDPAKYVYGKANDTFVKEKRTAMLGNAEGLLTTLKATENMNWDVAQYPSYSSAMNKRGMFGMYYILPMKQSKYKDDAMRVIEVLLSDESQEKMASTFVQASPLADPKFRQAFGKGVPEFQGKHLDSIFKSAPADGIAYSKYYSKANTLLGNKVKDYIVDGKDLNTALREADEEITKMIATEEGK